MSGLPQLSVFDIISGILAREGSAFTDRSADRGGPTRYGITLPTLQRHRPKAGWSDVRDLDVETARKIYEDDYITAPGFDKITDSGLRVLLVDFGVTSGPGTAIKALQFAVGVDADGILGSGTRTALLLRGASEVYASVLRQYFRHFVEVALTDAPVVSFRREHPSSQLANLRGWINRAAEFIR